MNTKMIGLFAILIVGLSTGVGIASVFWTSSLGASVTVVASPYKTRLYSDSACTVEMTSLDFGTLVESQEGTATSEWIDVYLQLEEVPTEIVYVHVNTSGTLPDEAVIEGQKWRYLTSVYADCDVGDDSCDGSLGTTSPLVNGKVTEVFRFRITMPTTSEGTYDEFGITFTMTDSTTN